MGDIEARLFKMKMKSNITPQIKDIEFEEVYPMGETCLDLCNYL